MQARLVALLRVVQSIHHASHRIRRDYVGALAAHVATRLGIFHVLQLLKDVETFEHHHQLVVEEGAHQAGIPYEVVGIQILGGVQATTVEIEIVCQVELPRQMQVGEQP